MGSVSHIPFYTSPFSPFGENSETFNVVLSDTLNGFVYSVDFFVGAVPSVIYLT